MLNIVFQRGIHRGLLTLLRERQWMTALGALFGIFLLVQLLVLVLVGLEGMQSLLKNRTDLHIEIHESASDQDLQEFFSALQQLSYVRTATLITKEKAYENTRMSDPNLIAFLEEYDVANPFPDTIGVTLSALDDYESFSAFIQKPRWQPVIHPEFLSQITDQEERVFALLSVTGAGRTLTVIILVLTAGALVFITTELVRRRAIARSDEVLVERLVGATPLSITLPFITESIVLLWCSITLSAAALLILIAFLPTIVPALHANGVLGPLRAHIAPLLSTFLPWMILIELLVAPLIATVGAWLGVRPQVRSPRITFSM